MSINLFDPEKLVYNTVSLKKKNCKRRKTKDKSGLNKKLTTNL